jgi:uncharacterized protein YdeI (YjbR/CyaY-like superfamily)
METENPKIDNYLAEGCGRCPLGGTPDCKVHSWQKEMILLRGILLDCGLIEELKWGVPCYTYKGNNILILAAFKDYCSISFFKGALLFDSHSILKKPGENSQAARLIQFTDIQTIRDMELTIKSYVFEAIEVEKAGLKVDFKEKTELQFPEELIQLLDQNPTLKIAFEALTPGRQRGYNLYFTAPKQSKTRWTRIEKCIPQILKGKGLHD